jgi:hypothetical protein
VVAAERSGGRIIAAPARQWPPHGPRADAIGARPARRLREDVGNMGATLRTRRGEE